MELLLVVNSISLLLFFSLLHASSSSFPLYAPSCDSTVSESPLSSSSLPLSLSSTAASLRLTSAFFSGGSPILNNSATSSSSWCSLSVRSVSSTLSPTTLYVTAFFSFRNSPLDSSSVRFLRHIINRHPRLRRTSSARFELRGFYSSSTKRLCMVGNGLTNLGFLDVVVNLSYPNRFNLESGFATGTLVGTDKSRFEPVSILGFPVVDDYAYTYVGEEMNKGVFRVYDDSENVDIKNRNGICSALRRAGRFELEYFEDCENVGCNPLNGSSKSLPSFMSLNEITCDGDKVRYLLDFSDLNMNGRRSPFHPNTTLVAEGAWNEKLHLDLVACRWLNVNDSLSKASIGDCSIRLSLRFPSILSLKNRSSVVGMIWSSKKGDDQGYFGNLTFQSPTNGNMRMQYLKYVYTVIENATVACPKKVNSKANKEIYPGALSSDLRFDMVVKDSKGQQAWGYSSPLTVGDQLYQHGVMFADEVHTNSTIQTSSLNVSYIISFHPPPGFKLGGDKKVSVNFVEISAEGTYDPTTGSLCMLGCRHIKPLGKISVNHGTLDCELLINLQFSSVKSTSGSEVKGTIQSNRPKTDLLYFDKLKLSATSISSWEARESIWAMDFEITMVLISNTLMCIFVVLQLFYVKKFPDMLPFVSLVMLTVLTLAQLIPLVLNFEALFKVNGNKQNFYLGSGGWVEVNEVLVRVITMVAFLLEFRLLQQAWSSRLGNGISNAIWASEKKVLYISIPVYIGGALIAWLVHEWKYSHNTPVINVHRFGYKRYSNSFWLDFKSYVGLILDGFLLPQITFNVFTNTREKALSPYFYIGTTVVRLLPHAYDLFRGHDSGWRSGGIYADPGMDYYSTIWDIAIFIGGLVFIVLVYLQQRFGGRCFLPKRFRESVEYEKVSVVSTELSPL